MLGRRAAVFGSAMGWLSRRRGAACGKFGGLEQLRSLAGPARNYVGPYKQGSHLGERGGA